MTNMAESMQEIRLEGTPEDHAFKAVIRGPLAAAKIGTGMLKTVTRPKGKLAWYLVHMPSGSWKGYGRYFAELYATREEVTTVLEALLPTLDWEGQDRYDLACSLKARGWHELVSWGCVPTPEDILQWCGRQPGGVGPRA